MRLYKHLRCLLTLRQSQRCLLHVEAKILSSDPHLKRHLRALNQPPNQFLTQLLPGYQEGYNLYRQRRERRVKTTQKAKKTFLHLSLSNCKKLSVHVILGPKRSYLIILRSCVLLMLRLLGFGKRVNVQRLVRYIRRLEKRAMNISRDRLILVSVMKILSEENMKNEQLRLLNLMRLKPNGDIIRQLLVEKQLMSYLPLTWKTFNQKRSYVI